MRRVAPRVLAFLISLTLVFPAPVSALREPSTAEKDPDVRAGLEEALRSGDPTALIRVASSRLAQWISPAPAAAPNLPLEDPSAVPIGRVRAGMEEFEEFRVGSLPIRVSDEHDDVYGWLRKLGEGGILVLGEVDVVNIDPHPDDAVTDQVTPGSWVYFVQKEKLAEQVVKVFPTWLPPKFAELFGFKKAHQFSDGVSWEEFRHLPLERPTLVTIDMDAFAPYVLEDDPGRVFGLPYIQDPWYSLGISRSDFFIDNADMRGWIAQVIEFLKSNRDKVRGVHIARSPGYTDPEKLPFIEEALREGLQSLAGLEEQTKLTWKAWWTVLGAWGPTKQALRKFGSLDRSRSRSQINRLINQLIERGMNPRGILKFGLSAVARVSPTADAFQANVQALEGMVIRLVEHGTVYRDTPALNFGFAALNELGIDSPADFLDYVGTLEHFIEKLHNVPNLDWSAIWSDLGARTGAALLAEAKGYWSRGRGFTFLYAPPRPGGIDIDRVWVSERYVPPWDSNTTTGPPHLDPGGYVIEAHWENVASTRPRVPASLRVIPADQAGMEEDEAASLHALRDRINLLPEVEARQASVGLIAGPADPRGWAYGLALLKRARTATEEQASIDLTGASLLSSATESVAVPPTPIRTPAATETRLAQTATTLGIQELPEVHVALISSTVALAQEELRGYVGRGLVRLGRDAWILFLPQAAEAAGLVDLLAPILLDETVGERQIRIWSYYVGEKDDVLKMLESVAAGSNVPVTDVPVGLGVELPGLVRQILANLRNVSEQEVTDDEIRLMVEALPSFV